MEIVGCDQVRVSTALMSWLLPVMPAPPAVMRTRADRLAEGDTDE
jgi:hypothetical protein